jgi:hypothetical protein
MIFKALLIALPMMLAAQQHTMPSKEKAAPPPEIPPSSLGKTTILIPAKARADDLVKAYDYLKKDKPTFRISARLSNGHILANISEMTAMPNGTLFIFKFSTPQGTSLQIVSIEEIMDFFYS